LLSKEDFALQRSIKEMRLKESPGPGRTGSWLGFVTEEYITFLGSERERH